MVNDLSKIVSLNYMQVIKLQSESGKGYFGPRESKQLFNITFLV